MKLLIVLLAFSALVSAEKLNGRSVLGRSVSSQAVEALEKLREQMPCGFPQYGIPPLAPFEVQHKALAVKNNFLSVDGEVNGVRIDGLDKFEIVDMKVNVIFSKVTFKFKFPSIVIKSLYDLLSNVKGYGFTVDLKGKGNILMELKNIEISGTIKYSIIKGIKLKSLQIATTIGDVDSNIDGIMGEGLGNRKLNELLEELILIGCNDNQEKITKSIEDFVVPKVNAAAEGYTLADIIGIIGGGEGAEPVMCVSVKNN